MTLHLPPVRALPLTRAARTHRRERLAALAGWTPWGPLGPRELHDRPGERLALRYLVRHSLDMEVDGPDGRIGRVERVVAGPYDFWPEELLVRAPDGGRVRVRAARVRSVEPRRGRLVVSA